MAAYGLSGPVISLQAGSFTVIEPIRVNSLGGYSVCGLEAGEVCVGAVRGQIVSK